MTLLLFQEDYPLESKSLTSNELSNYKDKLLAYWSNMIATNPNAPDLASLELEINDRDQQFFEDQLPMIRAAIDNHYNQESSLELQRQRHRDTGSIPVWLGPRIRYQILLRTRPGQMVPSSPQLLLEW